MFLGDLGGRRRGAAAAERPTAWLPRATCRRWDQCRVRSWPTLLNNRRVVSGVDPLRGRLLRRGSVPGALRKVYRLQDSEVENVHGFYARFGRSTVFWSRFIPFVRGVASFPAGISRMQKRYFICAALGSAIFCSAWPIRRRRRRQPRRDPCGAAQGVGPDRGRVHAWSSSPRS